MGGKPAAPRCWDLVLWVAGSQPEIRPQGGEQVVLGPKNETWPRWWQAVSLGSRRRQGGRRKHAVYLGVWTSVYRPGEDIFGLEDESNTGSKIVIPEAVAERECGELVDHVGNRGEEGREKTSTGVYGVNLALFSKGSEAASGNTRNTRKWTIYVRHPAGKAGESFL